MAEVARWSDEAQYKGVLIYTDNRLVDPWLVAQLVLESSESLCPLVAVQPIYMHPYWAAKKIASLAFLHGRRVCLNMLAGGFKNDLSSLGDETPHDERYARTVEYALIIEKLLTAAGPVDYDGAYYKLANAILRPSVPKDLLPSLLISGSSEAGMAAARAIGATAVRYPAPPTEENDESRAGVPVGIRIGVVARETAEEAWEAALERFPEDRKGKITHALAMRVSDSQWHRQLSELAESEVSATNPYWLGPFQNYKTFCPYLVGSYEQVGRELARYRARGFRTFILDVPPSCGEFVHTGRAFAFAAVGGVESVS